MKYRQLLASLSEQGWKRAHINGAKIIQSFMREGLIADITLTVVPILIAEGKRMFGALNADSR
jgi:dihydrofolate reductase